MLGKFMEKFKLGEQNRMKYTIPSLVMAFISIVNRIHATNYEQTDRLNYENLFEIIKEMIEGITESHPELAIKLYLELVSCVNVVDSENKYFDEFSYGILSQILMIYQDSMGEEEAKVRVINLLIGKTITYACIGEENYDTLVTNITQKSSKLLRKTDQCLTIL